MLQAKPMLLSKNHSGLVDPSLGDAYDSEQMNRMVMVASLCIQQASTDRPQMSQACYLKFYRAHNQYES